MFNRIVEFLFCADIIKTPKVFCLTFGVQFTRGHDKALNNKALTYCL